MTATRAASGFASADKFSAPGGYQLLPFRFLRLDGPRYVATNLVGEHLVLPRDVLVDLIEGRLASSHPRYADLQSRHFFMTHQSDVAMELLATQWRTKLEPLSDFTSLHLFVVTLRCDHSCPYCQVSRVSEDKRAFDMTPEMADRAVDLLFQSPSPQLKVEFQGGEPLLNFPLIRRVVEAVQARNAVSPRDIRFVIATNLAHLSDEVLSFCREHHVYLSTSLDGPANIHDANRPRPGGDSHARVVSGVERARHVLGPDAVAAVLTTTRRSLTSPGAIVDEYVRLGFHNIFLRWLSPFGFAARSRDAVGYDPAAWQDFYVRALRHVIAINRGGYELREESAGIILRKLLTPYASGYVDLQSPTGLGISVVAYNYDGDVYLSDEGRMLAETGDRTFRVGNVLTHTYEEIFYSERLQDLVLDTMTEAIPQCTDCAFQPVCGTDPVFHHATQGDLIGHRPTSDFCRRNMFVMKHLVTLLEDDPHAAAVLRSWV